MNLLFDFVSAYEKTGAGEYLRRIFYSLLESSSKLPDLSISVLYDSSLGIGYSDLLSGFVNRNHNIPYFDCCERPITEIVLEYKIDRFFIACAQTFKDKPEIADLQCEVICVSHDLYCEDNVTDKLFIYQNLLKPGNDEPATFHKLKFIKKVPIIKQYLSKVDRFALQYICHGGSRMYDYMLQYEAPVINLYHKNSKTKLVTVSEYSKASMIYHYNIPSSDITVLYSPARIMLTHGTIENEQLNKLINSKKKYFLMVSAGRDSKNPHKVVNAFRTYSETHPDEYLVTVGYEGKKFDNHIVVPFLCESDLAASYSHCYAFVFASFFEGFGYPPIEAMKYGKPVLSSNTTSMPEILGNAPIYFSPFYESAIFQAFTKLDETNYELYSRLSKERYEVVRERQDRDLNILIDMLVK
ncbi:MAG: glycosyltransferase [Bacteroidales bacterium]|nr:glycosyltransferase [Bacteroidales bacterium]